MITSRRNLLAAGAAASVTLAVSAAPGRTSNAARFSLAYAPHEGSFASRGDLLEQIAYAADQGFTAWEDNGARDRPVAQQAQMAKALAQRNMKMGVFVANTLKWGQSRPWLGGDDGSERESFLADIAASVEVAKRLAATCITVVPGFLAPKVPVDIQTARIIDLMRRAGDIVAPHNMVLVMEPLNTLTDHPGVYLQTIAQGFAVARGVNSPSVKILADLYHAQIQAGNLIPTLDACWSEIAYLQFGDNPGRKEPTSGEINYTRIVRWLRARSFTGMIGMEHGNSLPGREGEDRLVAAYREIDGG